MFAALTDSPASGLGAFCACAVRCGRLQGFASPLRALAPVLASGPVRSPPRPFRLGGGLGFPPVPVARSLRAFRRSRGGGGGGSRWSPGFCGGVLWLLCRVFRVSFRWFPWRCVPLAAGLRPGRVLLWGFRSAVPAGRCPGLSRSCGFLLSPLRRGSPFRGVGACRRVRVFVLFVRSLVALRSRCRSARACRRAVLAFGACWPLSRAASAAARARCQRQRLPLSLALARLPPRSGRSVRLCRSRGFVVPSCSCLRPASAAGLGSARAAACCPRRTAVAAFAPLRQPSRSLRSSSASRLAAACPASRRAL